MQLDTMSNGNFSSFIVHQESTFTRKLDSTVKDRAIQLLFGEVTNEQRCCIHSFMDELYSLHHCMALYMSHEEKSRKQDMSPFHKLCNKLGLDPGRKEVIINNDGEILFSKDYYSKPELLSEQSIYL